MIMRFIKRRWYLHREEFHRKCANEHSAMTSWHLNATTQQRDRADMYRLKASRAA